MKPETTMTRLAETKLAYLRERGYTQQAVVMTGPGGCCMVSNLGRVIWLKDPSELAITGAERTAKQIHDEAEIARLRKKCEWQKTETAPENAWVLGASDNGIVVAVVMLVVENGERQWFTEPYEIADRYHRDGTFTHWMPLPEPPNKH